MTNDDVTEHLKPEEQLIYDWAKQLGQRVLNTPSQGYDSETVLYSGISTKITLRLFATIDAYRADLAGERALAARLREKLQDVAIGRCAALHPGQFEGCDMPSCVEARRLGVLTPVEAQEAQG